MRYLILATDYDGTLAHDGRVNEATIHAMERLSASGRKLILVTGRELDDLQTVFSQLQLFEWVVAENGAVLYRPATKEEIVLAAPPLPEFARVLRRRGVEPLSQGRVIVATTHPHETTVLELIRELGLGLQVIFNKGSVMVLPAGITKATGLAAALAQMSLSPHNVVAIGDAENDYPFLQASECAVAVANALPPVRAAADFTTHGDHGVGVCELIDELLADDLVNRDTRLQRHHIPIGTTPEGTEVFLRPYGFNLLVVGPSGSGKSTLVTGLLEQLAKRRYQFCVIDPEGDYDAFAKAVALGTSQRAPTVEEVIQVLKEPETNAVVSLVGLPIAERPGFFLALLPRLLELRSRTGRPHWLMVDETHHMLPATWEPAAEALPQQLTGAVRITVRPGLLSPASLASVDTILVVGQEPAVMLTQFATLLGEQPPSIDETPAPGEVILWERHPSSPPRRVRITPARTERRRHNRKYAEGNLPPDRSFYFRGPEGKLNLRAQNLILFTQLADGVDDATWLHHFRQGDYSRWFRTMIKDDILAAESEALERQTDLSPSEGRARLKKVIERHYTLPADPPTPIAGSEAMTK